jgi:AcrR family transcriptional regulator
MDCTFTQFVRKMKKNSRGNSLHTVNKSRVEPSLRRDQLLNVAINVAIESGYNNLTRDAIAKQAGVSVGLISNYFGTIKQLKRAIMRAAVKRSIPEIVAQGLANKDVHALKASQDLKTQAATLIANY